MSSQKESPSFLIVDSFNSISGLTFAFLKCPNGRIANNIFLFDKNGIDWKIIDNDVKIGGVGIKKMVEEKLRESIFLYQLESKPKILRPEIGQVLFLSPPSLPESSSKKIIK